MADQNMSIASLLNKAADNSRHRQQAKIASFDQLEAAMKQLLSQYGMDAVQATLTRLAHKKIGRKEEQDWPLLGEVLKQDAREWLDGNEPFKVRSNYAVAIAFAKTNPGHNAAATQRRIMGKLARKRKNYLPYLAWEITGSERSYATYQQDCERICAISNSSFRDIVVKHAQLQQNQLERYRDLFGEPTENATMTEIEERINTIKAESGNLRSIMLPFIGQNSGPPEG